MQSEADINSAIDAACDNILDDCDELTVEEVVPVVAPVVAEVPKVVTESKSASKKKPGRPKKPTTCVPIEVHGIVNAPVNEGDLLELVYSNPTMFKKLFLLYKQYEVSEIEMNFDPVGLKIITKDHIGKSNIYATIDGGCTNLYYCKKLIRICVNRDSLEKILKALIKTNYKITFVLREEDYRKTLHLITREAEYDTEDTYAIDVVFKPEEVARVTYNDDDTDYPIKFQLTSKHFKSRINHIRELSPTLTIQKSGDEPLQFTFDKAQKIHWTSVYNNAEKIKLKSTIEPGDIFNASVVIDYIKPFSNSSIGDDVFIAADKHKKMSFMTRLDKHDLGWTCWVKIYTDIKEYRE